MSFYKKIIKITPDYGLLLEQLENKYALPKWAYVNNEWVKYQNERMVLVGKRVYSKDI